MTMNDYRKSFFSLLDEIKASNGNTTVDFIAQVLPLLEKALYAHNQDKVLKITSIDQVLYNGRILIIEQETSSAVISTGLPQKPKEDGAVKVSDTIYQNRSNNVTSFENQSDYLHLDNASPVKNPAYVMHYKAWDYEMGTYDPLTEVFLLGMLMASLAYGLDFRDKDELLRFVENRERLYFLNKELDPTIHHVIREMTPIYREDRIPNLEEVVAKLKNYQDFNPENYQDLTETIGFKSINIKERGTYILDKLRRRLFDISRRNKLLYFKSTSSFLNLTEASIPLLLDHKNITEKDIIFWGPVMEGKLLGKKSLLLNRYLDITNNRFLNPILNKIRLEARKSRNEYGFDQLRLVIAFLHWYNFKENREERISSPLLLLPVSLVKKKGVEDRYQLEVTTTDAEINPVLSYYLKDLYNIELPDFIDLKESSLEDLIGNIRNQILNSGNGVELQWREKPQIQLIHKAARRNFKLKKRKLNRRTSNLNLRQFDYSYKEDDFKPLGIELFKTLVHKKINDLEYIINEDINPYSDLAVAEKERSFYRNDNYGVVNPLVWEVDTCNMTLGNFNYRKMSIVRDYNDIINADIKDEVFEELFSENPRKLIEEEGISTQLNDLYPIIAADPTQTKAVYKARSGRNYIIQGPPGTGKSQTITNLIADYVARDQKVLFVCEKRAALDVVYHRLKNKQLDELCCLIHDSQTDKKSFIMNLKGTYESFLKDKMKSNAIVKERNEIIDKIQTHINRLESFHNIMRSGETPIFQVYQEVISDIDKFERLAKAEYFVIPDFDEWKSNENWIKDFLNQIRINHYGDSIKNFPLNGISPELLSTSDYKTTIHKELSSALTILEQINEWIDENDGDTTMVWDDWIKEVNLMEKSKGIIAKGNLAILTPDNPQATALLNDNKKLEKSRKKWQDKQDENRFWKVKWNAIDAYEIKNQWDRANANILKFLNPKWYRLKKQIKEAYDFQKHKVKPEIDSVLSRLVDEYDLLNSFENEKRKLENRYGFTNYDDGIQWLKQLHNTGSPIVAKWIEIDNRDYLSGLISVLPLFNSLRNSLSKIAKSFGNYSIATLEDRISGALTMTNSLSLFKPHIEKLNNADFKLQSLLRDRNWREDEINFHCAYKTILDNSDNNPVFAQMNEDSLQFSIREIQNLLDKYYNANVAFIRSRIRDQFLNKIRITESTAAQLTNEEKELKKIYKSSRKILENEFNKKMRYKSIRELATGEAQEIMTSLKPVWLMSPLSVSDSMPIDTSIFDVVIYDEASQITVEEGVPSLFRTHQTIIVGDEMQMPPTNFFSTTSVDVDEDEEEQEQRIGINLDADSLLNQGARKLPSVMLGWHYRSRRESLISYSNAAFYKRELLTIPDNQLSIHGAGELTHVLNPDQEIDINDVLQRSISYHYLENAVYHKRSNKDEATYIAHLVRKLLTQQVNKSIGVVAFSMEQQSVIESALEELALLDTRFGKLLEEEYNRTEEDQFTGLFVKNLENVQGDERDIIIMSVCYGFNTQGKMLMNFGPINRRGGEKRLNVIFSRAKRNMMIVSSILGEHIKNDYNEGARYFKRFLQYAKQISDGNIENASSILDSLHVSQNLDLKGKEIPLKSKLKEVLKAKGYEVYNDIGQSHFKVDIAIISPNDTQFKMGILLDYKSHYHGDNVLEQYCQKTSVLETFGWKILRVYVKDWVEQPNRVLERIRQTIENEEKLSPVTATNHEREMQEVVSEDVQQVSDSTIESQSSQTSDDFKRYEYVQGNSNKFWEIKVIGNEVHTRYGRIGNQPQTNVKSLSTRADALKEEMRLTGVKLRKGYRRS